MDGAGDVNKWYPGEYPLFIRNIRNIRNILGLYIWLAKAKLVICYGCFPCYGNLGGMSITGDLTESETRVKITPIEYGGPTLDAEPPKRKACQS